MEKKHVIMTIIIVLSAILILYFKDAISIIRLIINIVNPVLLGVFFALLVNSIMVVFNNKVYGGLKAKHFKLARILSLFTSYVVVIFILCLALYFLLPQVANSLSAIVKEVPGVMTKVVMFIDKIMAEFNIEFNAVENVNSNLTNAINSLISGVIDITPNVLEWSSNLITFISNTAFAVVFSMYILYDKEGMKERYMKAVRVLFKGNVGKRIAELTEKFLYQFNNFFSGQVIEAFILGSLCFVGMLILAIPYAPLISLIITITALVPIFGAIIGTVPAVIILLIASPVKAVIFVMFVCVLQLVEGNLIYPHVVGNRLELPPFFVLFSLIVGGALLGVIGIAICVPLTSVIYKELTEYIDEKYEIIEK